MEERQRRRLFSTTESTEINDQGDESRAVIWSAATRRRFHLSRSDGFVSSRLPLAVAVHLKIGRFLLVRLWRIDPSPLAVAVAP